MQEEKEERWEEGEGRGKGRGREEGEEGEGKEWFEEEMCRAAETRIWGAGGAVA